MPVVPLLPTSDGLPRDLRRGVVRAFLFASFASAAFLADRAVGVVAISVCLVWIPHTLIEGWATRRPGTLWSASLLVGALATVTVLGAAVQLQYLKALRWGLTPGGALGGLQVQVDPGLLLLAAPLGVLLSTHLAGHVCLQSQSGGGWRRLLLFTAAIIGIGALGLGLVTLLASGPEFVLRVIGISLGLLTGTAVVWFLIGFPAAALADHVEARRWPREAEPA